VIVQRMPWAGVVVKTKGTTVAIDPLYHVNTDFFGEPRQPFFPLDDFGAVDAVLITHLHSDHFDPRAIAQWYGTDVPVYVPTDAVETAKQSALTRISGVSPGESFVAGEMKIAATYSEDGLGDPQIAWVIQAEGKRIIHCGDTLWHGHWWTIARTFGGFDVACLPINAAVIQDPDLTPSGEPICLSPEQAVSAAVVLGAQQLVPIHYGAFHNPPVYDHASQVIERLRAAAGARKVNVTVLEPKEQLEL
jgi:L-ascorbate metabolism protein UlaG (beta-lactamase superfamily)